MTKPLLLTKEYVKNLLPSRPVNSNKGTFGKVLNIAGSFNYQGAAFLSSVAALKVGAGLVTLASIENVINSLASSAPWITFLPLKDYYKKCIAADAFSDLKDVLKNYTVVSVGPGLTDSAAVGDFVDDLITFLNNSDKKMVIDADALNVIAQNTSDRLPENSVITPHPMEMSRLLGIPVEQIQDDRIAAAKLASEKFGCTVVLKGNKTVICSNSFDIFVNTTGNSALAKAGSGDVLTGMIAGFMAQGVSSVEAAILGVYLHGLCGEIASKTLTEYSVLATNQIDTIPVAIKSLMETYDV